MKKITEGKQIEKNPVLHYNKRNLMSKNKITRNLNKDKNPRTDTINI